MNILHKVKLTKEEQEANEDRFRSLCIEYSTDPTKEIWDEMWDLVCRASESIVKSMLKGVDLPEIELEEIILDTTIAAMGKIRKEFEKNNCFVLRNKLVTFCRSYALYPLYKPNKKFNDRVISLEGYRETHSDLDLSGGNND